ncbi:MAG: pyridoxamine 5'-phosphate oxidase family protein [Pseudomonadota bacterium]
MISDNEAFEQFINDHRWAVLTTMRGQEEPVNSVVAYARDGDDLVVSTPGTTFKAKSAAKNPKVNLCIISNQEPFNFVAIEGQAQVNRDELEAKTALVFKNLEAVGYTLPEDFPGWLEKQQRVIIRISPIRVYGVIR